MKSKKAITLAETMTAALMIGIIAAMAVPSLMKNYNQIQFKTGLKKAVRTINEAISMNIAKGEKSAYYTNESSPLFYYLQKNMSVLNPSEYSYRDKNNSEFYTKDDIRFEFPRGTSASEEFDGIVIGDDKISFEIKDSNCGSYGLATGENNLAANVQPCVILVDVNGDSSPNELTASNASSLSDMFLILVTDKAAFPYGSAAQKAYYGEE